MMRYSKIFLISLLLTGCSFFDSDTDRPVKPKPLPELKSNLRFDLIWSTNTSHSINSNDTKLQMTAENSVIYTANQRGQITATDLKDGQRLWQINAKAAIASGPAVGKGLVIVGTSDGKILAFRSNTGEMAWQTPVTRQVLASPTIVENLVLVKTVEGTLLALDPQNGQIRWTHKHGAPLMTLRGGSAPQVAGNKVITGFSDGKLAAHTSNQGRLLWESSITLPTGATEVERIVDIDANPIVVGNTIYVASYDGTVAAVATQTGEILWQQNLSSVRGLTIDNNYVFVTEANGVIRAFLRKTGAEVWQQTQLRGRDITATATLNGLVLVGDSQGYLHCLKHDSGEIVGRTLVNKAGIVVAPFVVGNQVIMAIKNGSIVAYRVS